MQGTPKAIEIKGIVRNATVIGAQDGQAEDLINLRFMDGSWRASGDGRLVHTMSGTQYTQLYVHTNVYHHLLGVCQENGQSVLKWFADIDADQTTFSPLTTPIAIGEVADPTDITYSQVGHLLTYISAGTNTSYLFSEHKGQYIKKYLDYNGNATDEFLAPVGQMDVYTKVRTDQHYTENSAHPKMCAYRYPEPPGLDSSGYGYDNSAASHQLILAGTAAIRAKLEEENSFHLPFLVVVAYKLYDGSYIAAHAPKLVIPNEYIDASYVDMKGISLADYRDHQTSVEMTMNTPTRRIYVCPRNIFIQSGTNIKSIETQKVTDCYHKSYSTSRFPSANPVIYMSKGTVGESMILPNQIMFTNEETLPTVGSFAYVGDKAFALGTYNDLYLRCGKVNKSMEGIITDVCVFISPWINPYKKITDTDGVYVEKPYYFRLYDDEYETVYGHIRVRKTMSEIQDEIANTTFYLYKKIDFSTLTESEIKLEVEAGVLKNIVQQDRLPNEAFDRNSYMAKVLYTYNSRLHMANYSKRLFLGYPISEFQRAVSVKSRFESSQTKIPVIKVTGEAAYSESQAIANAEALLQAAILQYNKQYGGALVTIKDASNDIIRKASRYLKASDLSLKQTISEDTDEDDLDTYTCILEAYTTANWFETMVSYPSTSATQLQLSIAYVTVTGTASSPTTTSRKSNTVVFTLKPMLYYNVAFALSTYSSEIVPIDKKISFTSGDNTFSFVTENIDDTYPNAMRVSKADQPMFFPYENTYQVGSAQILALMSNTIAVGTGQTGAAPLYVFCKDGVYALFVDASGQMTYSNSRVLARDVCNNPRSVTPIDAGVVFTTDRGLMMIAGEQVEEIGAPCEGDVLKYADLKEGNKEFIKAANGALRKVADLPDMVTDTDFLTYLQDKGTIGKAAIINYNHNMRELIVSNPNYSYSYVMDREGNWSRRDYTAIEYVNNYPTSYRVSAVGQIAQREFYKMDDEGDVSTSLEHRKEADNKIFYLSDVIKLDSIGFKQAYRFVVRGYFEAQDSYQKTRYINLNTTITSSNMDMEHMDELINVDALIQNVEEGDTLQFIPLGSLIPQEPQEIQIVDIAHDTIYLASNITIASGVTGFGLYKKKVETIVPHVGIYVFGSYDGRKWAMLGGNEKTGKFTNIGCLVEHTDVRFFRVCLAGQVTGKTRIDYMEMSACGSILNGKIR